VNDFPNKFMLMFDNLFKAFIKWAAFLCCLFTSFISLLMIGIDWAHDDYCATKNGEYFIMEFPRDVQIAIGCPNYITPTPEPPSTPKTEGYELYMPDDWEIEVMGKLTTM
jgi:hypothetical protein